MEYEHRGRRTVIGILGSVPFMMLVVWWTSREPVPGGEGGRGPLTARGLYAQAVRESNDGDRARTERHLRMALDVIARPGATADDRGMELRVRSSLARVLRASARVDEARAVAAPACTMGPEHAAPEELIAAGLCER